MQDFGTALDVREMLEIEAGLPQSIVIGGTPYACVAGGVTEDSELTGMGFEGSAAAVVFVRQSLFAAGVMPHKNQPVTLTSGGKTKSLRIDTVTPSEDGASYQLTCVDPTK